MACAFRLRQDLSLRVLYGHPQYVGYSQVSHATAEFDVTGFLKEGENLLAVLVLKCICHTEGTGMVFQSGFSPQSSR